MAFPGSVISSEKRNNSERWKEDMLILVKRPKDHLCAVMVLWFMNKISHSSAFLVSQETFQVSPFFFFIINLKKIWRPTLQTNEALY